MSRKTARFHVYIDKRKEWRWTFYAANGKKIADSAEGYQEQRKALTGLFLLHNGQARIFVDVPGRKTPVLL